MINKGMAIYYIITMEFEDPFFYILTLSVYLFSYLLYNHVSQVCDIDSFMNLGIDYSEMNTFFVQGSQHTYLTKVSKSVKTTNDYSNEFILLCCYLLRTRTEHEVVSLIKQILCTIKNNNIVTMSMQLSDDIYCDIQITHSSSDGQSKQTIADYMIEFKLSNDQFATLDIVRFLDEIREHYTGAIGNARADFICEMYTHLYNEPCLIDEDQLVYINKTPQEVLECYHRYPDSPDSFVKRLMKD